MELFVMNRHGDEKSEITKEEEKAKLDKLLKRVEKRKLQRNRHKQKEYEKQQAQKRAEKVDKERERQEANSEKQGKKVAKKVHSKEASKKGSSQVNHVDLENFTVLGAQSSKEKTIAKWVLPQWLANPTVIASNLQDLNVKVSNMKQLDKSIRKRLKSNGVRYFFPVQAEVIPWLLQVHKHADLMFPRDVCVSAPTGSGKTLTFVLPVIQALKHHTVRKIRALVILPTQDLAEQVFKSFKTYSQGTNIEIGLISGKHLLNQEQKQLVCFSESFGYVSKVDILVSTAGRLVSHLKMTEGFSLQSLEFLIIDEADRVLESTQDDWLYHLEKHIVTDNYSVRNKKVLNLATLQSQRSPQKLLFSATLTQDPEKIEKLSLFQPKLFTSVVETSTEVDGGEQETFAGKYTTPTELTEKYIVCSKELKPLVLYAFIKRENLTKTIVFTHSVESAHRLKIVLQSLFKSKLKIEEISSSMKGKSRDEFIASFSKGEIDLLICTDSLARGIDLPGIRCVVSYSAPKYLKTYIHRSGRTARAGESGLAVTMLHQQQLLPFKTLVAQLKKNIDEIKVSEKDLESLSELYKKSLNQLKETVNKEEKTGKMNLISKKKSIMKDKKVKKNNAVK